MRKIIACIDQINSFEGSLFIYSLSFSLLLTIAPALIVFVASFQLLNIDINQVIHLLSQIMPVELISPFIDFLLNKSSSSILVSMISMGVSLFLASRCIYSFLLIAISVEKVDYPKWSIRIYSVFEFVLIYLYVIGCVMLTSYLGRISFICVPVLYFAAAFVGFYVFYHLCTFKDRGKSYGLIGALFSTVAIYLVGLLFFQIVYHFTNYDSIYGPLASLMVLFLSVLVISMIIYMGYVLNTQFIHTKKEKNRRNWFFHFCADIETRMLRKVKEKYENRN